MTGGDPASLGELTEDEIEQVLHAEAVARLGCHADGITYVVPVAYVYDGSGIIGHSAGGMKIEMMRKNPDVCIEVDHMENMANWRSVIAWGTFRELEGEEAMSSMHRLIDRLTPLLSSVTSQPTHGLEATHGADTAGRSVVIYRIDFQRKTGRFERR